MRRTRTLVVGAGSIGTRHINNLRTLGIGPLAVVTPNPEKRRDQWDDGTVACFTTMDEGLRWKPDLVIVASPSHLHVRQAEEAARAGCHLFIEKPLSHSLEGLEQLCDELTRQGLISMVGLNMRFHPGPAKVKELLDREAVGRVLFARIHTGSYLPEWRPAADYRQSYSAHPETGGGCMLDCIHEIDLAVWYLGAVDWVFCHAEHLSSLEIASEDVAVLVCKHAEGSFSEIHLDYVQRTYERGCQIVGEQGSLFWDYNDGTVRWYDAAAARWNTFGQPEGWDRNRMYLDEMAHLVDSLERSTPTALPVSQAMHVMHLVFAAKQSVSAGRVIRVDGVTQCPRARRP